MMGKQNVEIVHRAYEAVARGDLEGALEAFDASVAVEDHDRSLESTTAYRGHQGLMDLFALVNEGFEDVRYTAEKFTHAGDRVLVTVRRTGRGAASGVPVSEQQFHVFDFARDRIVRFRVFVERDQALQAAGLRE
jgi:ketosteroid isomerase-like protein